MLSRGEIMSVDEKMITSAELEERKVANVPGDRLIGSADANKQIFDKLGLFLAERINDIITEIANSPAGKDKISEDDLAPTILEKLNLHTESDHTHSNKDLLDGITAEKLLGKEITLDLLRLESTTGEYVIFKLDSTGSLYINLYNKDGARINYFALADTYSKTTQPLTVASGGTASAVKRNSYSDDIKANSTYTSSIANRRCWFIPYLDMLFFSFTAVVKTPKDKFVKIAQLPKITEATQQYAIVPSALSVCSYAENSTAHWKGRARSDGSIEASCDTEQSNNVTIYVSGFCFLY